MKVLLMGHPNVGKSVFFNRLTGAKVTESNYPGTTIDYTEGWMRIMDKEVQVVDVPGTFSLDPKDKAEEVAVKMLRESKDAVIVCVIDSSKIERSLYLALEIMEEGYPMVIALNMWDIARDKNIQVDVEKLEGILGVPVLPTIAVSGEGMRELVSRIEEAKKGNIQMILKNAEGMENEADHR